MAKPEASKEVRRKQLIDATIRAIGRFGYANATLTQVASEAGLSPGIVNFYFKSKEQLLVATLEQIADEYSTLWQSAINKGKVSPAAGLDAMIEADFHPSVCNFEKVSIWYAFWAEARSNSAYHEVVSRLEGDYLQQTETLCNRIIAEGGYQEIEGREIAVGLNAMIDGLWFDCLIDPKAFNRSEAKRVCRIYLASVFPAHFAGGRPSEGGPRRKLEGQNDGVFGNVSPAIDPDIQGRDAHRARLAVALRKRLEPVGKLKREALAAAVGVSVKTLESWLEGRGEPSSWQMGRLIPATDAQLWFEVYGLIHEEAQRLFEARLAQQQEQALRDRAALDALRAGKAIRGEHNDN
ncbi:transcriptional regulator BetI [Dongia soli]|uniref:Transcriptional regulator BetI n=1 Tax=Dongia soli TaxID=600628 RepID=A0ABU5EGY3_9PROT|nr:transcriptional regulator BetI [Dongia soli]MDY0885689.1 transcriptional regulator BetI [Dongia soli]